MSSAGFWPGGAAAPYPLFYSYAYPEPQGFAQASVEPPSARYDPALREFILRYEDVRQESDPGQTLLAFFESSYVAAAELGRWDRRALEVPQHTLRRADSTLRLHPGGEGPDPPGITNVRKQPAD